jgi:hypothetical protein
MRSATLLREPSDWCGTRTHAVKNPTGESGVAMTCLTPRRFDAGERVRTFTLPVAANRLHEEINCRECLC